MAEAYKIFPLRASPGIKKDGTQTEGAYWNDGQWMRFYRELPRSMLGYRAMTGAYPGPSRGCFVNLNPTGYIDIFSGAAGISNPLVVGQFTTDGFGSGVTNITPAGFTNNANNLWQFESFYNSNGSGFTSIIAHAAPNLTNITNSVAYPVYYGNILGTAALSTALDDLGNKFAVSGGVCSVPPYLIAYSSDGLVRWSALNNPQLFPVANAANPTATKIIKGLPIKGSSAPACLLWSIDSLLLMQFVGGDVVWTFTTISDQSSVLSSSAMVEFDGVYYWPGLDRWLVYNSVLRELPNEMNLDFFYTNLNFAHRQKVFGFKIPRWGEICWCAPLFGSTECNWMIVYNVRENTWYDTPLPSNGRSSAYFAQSWQYPVMFGATPYPDNDYELWQHEYGTDEIHDHSELAIMSYIQSPDMAIVGGGLSFINAPEATPDDVWTQLVRFEADFLINQPITVEISGRTFAMDNDTVLDSQTITNTNNNFDTQAQARYVRWKIIANILGGGFAMGTPLISYKPGDRNQG